MEFDRPVHYLDHDKLFDPDTGERVRCKRCGTKGNWVANRMKLKMTGINDGYQMDFYDCRYCGRETYMVRSITFTPVTEEGIANES